MTRKRSPGSRPCSAAVMAAFAEVIFSPSIDPEMSTTKTASRGTAVGTRSRGAQATTSVQVPSVKARSEVSWVSARPKASTKSRSSVALPAGATRTLPPPIFIATACDEALISDTGPRTSTSRSSSVPPARRIGGEMREASGTRSVSAAVPGPV